MCELYILGTLCYFRTTFLCIFSSPVCFFKPFFFQKFLLQMHSVSSVHSSFFVSSQFSAAPVLLFASYLSWCASCPVQCQASCPPVLLPPASCDAPPRLLPSWLLLFPVSIPCPLPPALSSVHPQPVVLGRISVCSLGKWGEKLDETVNWPRSKGEGMGDINRIRWINALCWIWYDETSIKW